MSEPARCACQGIPIPTPPPGAKGLPGRRGPPGPPGSRGSQGAQGEQGADGGIQLGDPSNGLALTSDGILSLDLATSLSGGAESAADFATIAAATSGATSNTLVKRDASGGIAANAVTSSEVHGSRLTVNGSLTGTNVTLTASASIQGAVTLTGAGVQGGAVTMRSGTNMQYANAPNDPPIGRAACAALVRTSSTTVANGNPLPLTTRSLLGVLRMTVDAANTTVTTTTTGVFAIQFHIASTQATSSWQVMITPPGGTAYALTGAFASGTSPLSNASMESLAIGSAIQVVNATGSAVSVTTASLMVTYIGTSTDSA